MLLDAKYKVKVPVIDWEALAMELSSLQIRTLNLATDILSWDFKDMNVTLV